MRYTIVVIVSCYIGLTYEFIAPKGTAENDIQGNYALNITKNSTNAVSMDQTTLLYRINTSLTTLLKVSNKHALEKDLLSDPQEKNSAINERAFIYIKSIKPVQNHLLNAYRDNYPGSHVLHRGEVFEDVARKFFDGYMKNGFFRVKGTDETIKPRRKNITNSVQKNNAENSKLKGNRNESDSEKRDYLELLKVPLLRTLSKTTNFKNLRLSTNALPKYTTESDRVYDTDLEDAETNKQVDRFIEQIISSSLENQFQIKNNRNKPNNKDCDDCINQVHIHTLCQCKPETQVKEKQTFNF